MCGCVPDPAPSSDCVVRLKWPDHMLAVTEMRSPDGLRSRDVVPGAQEGREEVIVYHSLANERAQHMIVPEGGPLQVCMYTDVSSIDTRAPAASLDDIFSPSPSHLPPPQPPPSPSTAPWCETASTLPPGPVPPPLLLVLPRPRLVPPPPQRGHSGHAPLSLGGRSSSRLLTTKPVI